MVWVEDGVGLAVTPVAGGSTGKGANSNTGEVFGVVLREARDSTAPGLWCRGESNVLDQGISRFQVLLRDGFVKAEEEGQIGASLHRRIGEWSSVVGVHVPRHSCSCYHGLSPFVYLGFGTARRKEKGSLVPSARVLGKGGVPRFLDCWEDERNKEGLLGSFGPGWKRKRRS